jgi:hypothetical protein
MDSNWRGRVLRFIESLRLPGQTYGRYRYAPSQSEAVSYASCYAALTRHLLGDLHRLSIAERAAWGHYIQSFQGPDGLFRDPALACDLAEKADWWGWRHLTCHALMALAALDVQAPYRLAWLDVLRAPAARQRWLDEQDWGAEVAFTSNCVQNWVIGLQYTRDVQHQDWADEAVTHILNELDRRVDVPSGLWGPPQTTVYTDKVWLSQRVQAAYHFWLLYLYEGRKPPAPQAALDHVLATQNERGGFGWGVHNPTAPLNSSACEDIDSLDPLVRLAQITDYRRDEVRAALLRARPWVESNYNPDGGAVFMRGVPFQYGHERMSSAAEESALFATWFRALSLAILDWGLGDRAGWHFLNAPGYQFMTSGGQIGPRSVG